MNIPLDKLSKLHVPDDDVKVIVSIENGKGLFLLNNELKAYRIVTTFLCLPKLLQQSLQMLWHIVNDIIYKNLF